MRRRIDDQDLMAREYEAIDRLAPRRLDVTGWIRDAGEPIEAR